MSDSNGDSESNMSLIDDAVRERMNSESRSRSTSMASSSVGGGGGGNGVDGRMSGARSHAGKELELPFNKPNDFDLLKILFTSLQSCVVPIVNIVLVAHFTPSQYMKTTDYAGKTFGFVFMATTPIILYAISAGINIEYTCRRYLYYRLMEQGYLVDFKNPDLTHSRLFYGVAFYFFVMLRIARGAWFSVLMNCVSLCVCWYGTLQFENQLISVNKFVECKDGQFDQESFKLSAVFLSKLHYISEMRLQLNALEPLEKPTDSNGGKYDLVSIAASRKNRRQGPLPELSGLAVIKKKAWVFRYLSQRQDNFVDEEDRKFARLAQRLAQGASAFGVGLFCYLFLVGVF